MFRAPSNTEIEKLSYGELHGWQNADHASALSTFAKTCEQLPSSWGLLSANQAKPADARSFIEDCFEPVCLHDGSPAHFTGYYEPVLRGSLRASSQYAYPIYGPPDGLSLNTPWLTRREIVKTGALVGRELLWLDDPVDVYFLQVQGSGRVRLDTGDILRVGYAGKNGHPYSSIGRDMLARGLVSARHADAESLKTWLRAHPVDAEDIFLTNPSFVFFERRDDLAADDGPVGAMGQPLTPMRSIAVDPDYVPLGVLVWVQTDADALSPDLMVAQDVGSAIKGAQRADIFFGTGDKAGSAAGLVNDSGRMCVLVPKGLIQ